MVNRLKEYLEEPEDELPEQDYWVVASQYEDFYVTREVAESVMRELDRPLLRRWLRFTDVNGSEVRVLTRGIDQVREWTKEQRAADRQFRRARRLEEKAERPSALELSKRLLYSSETLPFEDAIARGAEVNALARMTPDTRAGVRAFLEKKRKV